MNLYIKGIFIMFLLISSSTFVWSKSYIRSFLILGPVKAEDLSADCIKNENQLSPDSIKSVQGLRWKEINVEGNSLDFESDKAFGPNDFAMGFAYVKIRALKGQRAVIQLGSDDGARVYFNQEEVLINDVPRGLIFDEDKINIVLKEGWNELLVKVKDIAGGWGLAVRLTDPEGQDIPGLEYFPKTYTPVEVINAEASSEQYEQGEKKKLSADQAADGNPDTRWGSEFKDDQWLVLELNRIADIRKIIIDWQDAYAEVFEVLLSSDKKNWKSVFKTDKFGGGISTIETEPQGTKYIRINCIKRKTAWGNSIKEVRIFE